MDVVLVPTSPHAELETADVGIENMWGGCRNHSKCNMYHAAPSPSGLSAQPGASLSVARGL